MSNTNEPTVGFHTNPERINKDGRPPKGTSIAELVREYLQADEEDSKGNRVQRLDLLFKKLFNLGLTKDDVAAIKTLLAYGYGNPKQTIEFDDPQQRLKERKDYIDEQLRKIQADNKQS